MGQLVDGAWHADAGRWSDRDGTFRRQTSRFRNWVTADGTPGPTGEGGFAAEPGRYHLYVSLACPWAHRTLIMRGLKGLESAIGVSVVHWLMRDEGWTFAPGEGVVPDTVNGVTRLHELYTRAKPDVSGRVTVPVLWDRRRNTIVSNESSEILRMMNDAFDGVGARPGDYYPAAHRDEIDAVNARVYDTVNNGVYRAGFATEQTVYEAAVRELFASLDWLDTRLQGREFLVGDTLTEADIRLFTTLLRFDAVYHGHFKCNLRTLASYPNLSRVAAALAHHPAVAPTIDLGHIKRHYYESHVAINPTGIVPLGPSATPAG